MVLVLISLVLRILAANFQSVGREGLINYNQSVFFFELNDIMIDGEVIEFEPLSDTTNFTDLISLNSYLESLPFEVNNNSQLAYSVKYGVVSEEEQILEEGDFINYKVQLVDNISGDVLGVYDNVTFDENNLEVYDNINYIIETDGIGSRTVKMRLVVDYNVEADPNLATIFCESNLLEKSGAVTLNYNGAGEITTYDLSQNYPNPFNPTTTIKYQLPNAGNVSLKIYDVLGAEVMTLVNTTQAKGRYEVKFDASSVSRRISSGVYIYRIQANDYVASRKMMLLK
ncbi:MAG: T9SS C-terminal target domain-containing protein [Ignavibacteriae bacterium]|nr:T9SS C-terminal target domain-containing protein [Ignavibacteriota bacterium]